MIPTANDAVCSGASLPSRRALLLECCCERRRPRSRCRAPVGVGSSTRREEMSTLVHGTRTHPSSVLSALCVGGK